MGLPRGNSSDREPVVGAVRVDSDVTPNRLAPVKLDHSNPLDVPAFEVVLLGLHD